LLQAVHNASLNSWWMVSTRVASSVFMCTCLFNLD
jgi:hypothetical protein